MRAIIAHAIVADDCDRHTTTGGAVVHLGIPNILAAHKIHYPIGHCYKHAADRAEDVGGRVIVVRSTVADLAVALNRENMLCRYVHRSCRRTEGPRSGHRTDGRRGGHRYRRWCR